VISIILAGGSGSRLWPLSRELYPKQLLSLSDGNDNTLLQNTVLRLASLKDSNKVYIVTNVKHAPNVKYQISSLKDSDNGSLKDIVVISEPLARNTAPAIASAAKVILDHYQKSCDKDFNDVVIIAPSDHLIVDTEKFSRSVEKASALAEKGYIVTLGIRPTYPETGYGYIKTVEGNSSVVERFVEKPNLQKAQEYLENGNYFWNAGIFIAKLSTLLNEFKAHSENIYTKLDNISLDNQNVIDFDFYKEMPSISFDYAVMEKSHNVGMVELESDWNDLGSWKSIYDTHKKDDNGNVIIGNVKAYNVKNSLFYSQKDLVAVSDIENMIMVGTEDAVMACSLDNSQNVKKLFEMAKKDNLSQYKVHKTIYRPWGYYVIQEKSDKYLLKTVTVLSQKKMTYHFHKLRSEHWVILQGTAKIVLNGQEKVLTEGKTIDVDICVSHSIENIGLEDLKFVEVQKGSLISDEDLYKL
jgi:mannose-1-phosphate guanylyltransferase/mannose-6-phosphate isomerase